MVLEIGKKIFYFLWIVLVFGAISMSICNPEIFKPEKIASFIRQFNQELWLVYVVVCFFRGLFLLPGIPFLIVGMILFPNDLFLVVLVCLSGIIFSATLIYYFSDALGFSQYLERKYPKQIERWKVRLRKPRSILFVIAWALFPLVPTELICYLTGIVKMPYRNMIAGVFIGHLILILFYVFFGVSLFKWLF